MLTGSFIFLDGIGHKYEKMLYRQGIRNWNAFLSAKKITGLSMKRKQRYDLLLRKAKRELSANNPSYFSFPACESWRLYPDFKEDTVFLDIETSGGSSTDRITAVGLFDGIEAKQMLGFIDFKALQHELDRYKLIVTFNGSSFDIPMLKKNGIKLHHAHIDARHLCRKIGLTGGLKEIEKTLALKRDSIAGKMHGGDPITLWRMYTATGDEHYISLLAQYNEYDIVHLKQILEHCISAFMPFFS